ncbi:DegT/DnrJ/EryC1/StrS family aminotransferase [Desulfobacter latus]|uniref:DegT/DnrJ/EryC1/StrS family aminotransferase n=1 Tax=Desulfobacter latus TaxID=2292 RepID=A0A850SZU4_9BACT|nr:DegT/DnrJ/EryC1/StrS family aminotransferase [Desulfobacter latus]NWH04963.1 DegT/DnrJ/EryC1/StrS family aminotransferase [Desulfobacter latus]
MNKIPFMDLTIDSHEKEDILAAIDRVLSHGRLILGPEVDEFERKMAHACSRKYGIGVGSGTDALILALRALDIGRGDEVITSAYSWIATANAIALAGAKPVFADTSPDLTIDPKTIEGLITPATKAILAVDYAGKLCEADALMDISEKYGLIVIEDASQAYGAHYNGIKAGQYGMLSCISLNPMKNLGGIGEAGIILTDTEKLRNRLISLRYNGMIDKSVCKTPSHNGRLDTVQAAVLLKRMESHETRQKIRCKNARIYNDIFSTSNVIVPEVRPNERHVYFSYIIKLENRDHIFQTLSDLGIECKIRDSDYLPMQPAYHDYKHDAEWCRSNYEKLIVLPISEVLSGLQAAKVANHIVQLTGKPT